MFLLHFLFNVVVKRVPWTKEEVEEIRELFKHYLDLTMKRKCPGMNDCMHAIHRSKASGGVLWKRNWETLKKKVSHMIVMKRRGKFPKWKGKKSLEGLWRIDVLVSLEKPSNFEKIRQFIPKMWLCEFVRLVLLFEEKRRGILKWRYASYSLVYTVLVFNHFNYLWDIMTGLHPLVVNFLVHPSTNCSVWPIVITFCPSCVVNICLVYILHLIYKVNFVANIWTILILQTLMKDFVILVSVCMYAFAKFIYGEVTHLTSFSIAG